MARYQSVKSNHHEKKMIEHAKRIRTIEAEIGVTPSKFPELDDTASVSYDKKIDLTLPRVA